MSLDITNTSTHLQSTLNNYYNDRLYINNGLSICGPPSMYCMCAIVQTHNYNTEQYYAGYVSLILVIWVW